MSQKQSELSGNSEIDQEILRYNESLKDVYKDLFAEHAERSPEASGWDGDPAKVDLRFKILSEIDELDGTEILDFGCGTGLFLDFLEKKGFDVDYHGWDVLEDVIELGRQKFPDHEFSKVDIFKDNLEPYRDKFDYIFLSGVFTSRWEEKELHEKWCKEILHRLWPLCQQGMGFNMITEYADYKRERNYYPSIKTYTDFCHENFTRWFTVRHDYELYNHTIYVYKNPRVTLEDVTQDS